MKLCNGRVRIFSLHHKYIVATNMGHSHSDLTKEAVDTPLPRNVIETAPRKT